MPHVFFFSYAHANIDKELESFFEDLCEEVKVYTPGYTAKDPRLHFRDRTGIPMMEEWRPQIMDALQASSVLVCLTSPGYFASRFCGQEFYVFDQRRRAAYPNAPPPVILPIVWARTRGAPLGILDLVQWQEGGMDPDYEAKGLRNLKKVKPAEYARCVTIFADAIANAWQTWPSIPPLGNVQPFANIPNSFSRGNWQEAATPQGWISGPGVANFVFAAGLDREFPQPRGRYGATAADWRPYLPPEAATISELILKVTHRQNLLFREIPIDQYLAEELQAALARKNLTLIVADPQSLQMPQYHSVTVFDQNTSEGTAVLMPWDDQFGLWHAQVNNVQGAFQVRSQAKSPPFHAPIRTSIEFDQTLDTTLNQLRGAVTTAEAQGKPRTDNGPADLSGP